jgi:hypothetical protein
MTNANPKQVDALEINEAEDGLVVYDPNRETVHHLNPAAAVIFDLCDGTRDSAAIAAVLQDLYNLDEPPLSEVSAGLRDLAERQLIAWDHR